MSPQRNSGLIVWSPMQSWRQAPPATFNFRQFYTSPTIESSRSAIRRKNRQRSGASLFFHVCPGVRAPKRMIAAFECGTKKRFQLGKVLRVGRRKRHRTQYGAGCRHAEDHKAVTDSARLGRVVVACTQSESAWTAKVSAQPTYCSPLLPASRRCGTVRRAGRPCCKD
jgi:hypothetical protein